MRLLSECEEAQKIEVSPEMIEAGHQVFLRETDEAPEEVVADIYRAMEYVRKRGQSEVRMAATKCLERIGSAEGMAPSGTYDHAQYLKAALLMDWPRIKFVLQKA